MKHALNIAFDARTPLELVDFVRLYIAPLGIEERSQIHIKINDLLAEVGINGLKDLQHTIKSETGVDIIWMIDGKWFDIPNTIANYVKRLDGLNIAYYTVHASGGSEMIQAAKKIAPNTKLLAITILTSMKDDEVIHIYGANRTESILRLAKSALNAGADGLVCSPADAPMLRQVFGDDYLIVTPNIQREGVERDDDQNKALTNTPRGAIENGSSDIVVGRPILNDGNPRAVIAEMLEQMNLVIPPDSNNGNYTFEKLLHTGNWGALLKYIGAVYERPENGKYTRFASGAIADLYFNNGLLERDYRVINGIANHLADQIRDCEITADIVVGAQMGSIRVSLWLAAIIGIHESLYVEKEGTDGIEFKRHDLGLNGLKGKKIILSEDVVTKGSTIAKMIKIIRDGEGEVVAINCIVNRSNRDNFEGIPIFECYIAPPCGMWWDTETLRKTRENESMAGKTEQEISVILAEIQDNHPHIPDGAIISEKPKNEWNTLIESMR